MLLDGVYEEVVDDAPELAAGLLAGGAPLFPPSSWFKRPELDKPTALTVDPTGRVYGHIAAWDVNHIGLPNGTKPPRSKHDYAFFKTGVVKTEEGNDVAVGQITLAGGHAPLSADAGATVKHYDDTASAIADVTVGEDQHGIWVSGAMRPGISEEQIRALRASAPSGDWRPINGNLEMVAVCQVNVPGFPIARAMVSSGEMISLVAAGAAPLYQLRQENAVIASLDVLEGRMTRLEDRWAARMKQKTVTPADLEESEDAEDTIDRHLTLVSSAEMTKIEEEEMREIEERKMRLLDRVAKLRD
jgi:hypothetical protein